jgi:hypothetical protein
MRHYASMWLHASMSEIYVHVGCMRSTWVATRADQMKATCTWVSDPSRRKLSGVGYEYGGRAKGSQSGLSLGLLLSKGGMMKPVAGLPHSAEMRSQAARTSDSEE